MIKRQPEYRGIVHLVYSKVYGRFHLSGFGYGRYIAKAKEGERVATVICEEWKYGENDYRYINKEYHINNPYIIGQYRK